MNLSIPIIFFLIPFIFSCVGDKQSKIIRPDKKEIHDSSDPNIISFKAVGDTILGTNFPENRLIDNTDKLFANVLDLLQGSDLLFANYEATLTEYPKSSKDPNRPNTYAFRAPPEYAEILKKTGFDVLSVVNNHSFDFTETGFIDTMNHINNAGMLAVGGKNQNFFHFGLPRKPLSTKWNSGGFREGEIPVPIPNTEVKTLIANGTIWFAIWESRTLPGCHYQS
jgi:hypothetical protein